MGVPRENIPESTHTSMTKPLGSCDVIEFVHIMYVYDEAEDRPRQR